VSPASANIASGIAVIFKLWHLRAGPISSKLDHRCSVVATRCNQSRFHLPLVFSGDIVFTLAGLFDRWHLNVHPDS
jgi:hypothetical protein